jgi:hypothetical protein
MAALSIVLMGACTVLNMFIETRWIKALLSVVTIAQAMMFMTIIMRVIYGFGR